MKDGNVICGECAEKVRFLYPKSNTWLNVYSEGGYDEYGMDEETRWIDPLEELTYSQYQDALQKADEEREKRRALYGNHRACFRADDIFRIIKKYPKGKTVITDEYAVTGMVLLGTVQSSDEIQVHRRERTYIRTVRRTEIPHGESNAMEASSCISEGNYGQLILDGDAPYIYPGDILVID